MERASGALRIRGEVIGSAELLDYGGGVNPARQVPLPIFCI